MDIINQEQIINQTKKWIIDVVVGCNFCPFAAKEVKKNSIYYTVETSKDIADALTKLMREFNRLDEDENIETSFVILPNGFNDFNEYLHLTDLVNKLIKKEKYEGIYQVASFHPNYCFAGSNELDAANYTNRSIYPMLHILREESIEKALEKYPDPDNIPTRNIDFAQNKGLAYMKMLRDACL
ncbi:MAG: DUF1415 domain-containing protein [Chitinophagaceae bacterium]